MFPLGDAREDWAILRALSGALGVTLPYDSLSGLRSVLAAAHPHLSKYDEITPADPGAFKDIAGGAPTGQAFVSPITDFYLTNPIARASKTMAECSALANQRRAVAAE